eukprot:1153263-Pelagomonas_calceolata.AAC.9
MQHCSRKAQECAREAHPLGCLPQTFTAGWGCLILSRRASPSARLLANLDLSRIFATLRLWITPGKDRKERKGNGLFYNRTNLLGAAWDETRSRVLPNQSNLERLAVQANTTVIFLPSLLPLERKEKGNIAVPVYVDSLAEAKMVPVTKPVRAGEQ